MKTIRFALVLSLLLAFGIVVGASAQGPTSYTSGFQVQNLDDANVAAIEIVYYDKNGSVNATTDDTIAAGSSNTYFGANVDASDGFDGSVVISSDRPVAAVVNVLGDGGSFGGASYGSFSSGAGSANIPLLMGDFFDINSFFNVQNTGSSAVTVDVDYENANCTDGSATIEPGAAATFDQGSDCASGSLTAATVDANGGTIAVAVVQYDADSLLAYNGFTTDGSSNAAVPLVSQNFFGSRTGIQVQNTGDSDVSVTIDYTPSAGFPGSACSETKTVPANGSATFADGQLFNNNTNCNAASGWVGAAEIDAGSGNTVVAIVNTVTTGSPNASAYGAFNPDSATTTVSFPLVMDRNFGISTGLAVANVSGGPVDITCNYSGTSFVSSETGVANGAALTEPHQGKISDGYVGAATCTATGSIVGVINQLGTSGDALFTSAGVSN